MLKITERISMYTEKHLSVSPERAYAMYLEHGTCLKGLRVEGLIDDSGVEAYLKNVHDIDYSDISPDPELDAVLSRLRPELPTWLFTASIAEHAARCATRGC